MAKKGKWCGQIYSQKEKKMITVIPKAGESCSDARKRVATEHLRPGKTSEKPVT